MAIDWTYLRVSRRTRLRLQLVINSLAAAHEQGKYDALHRHTVLITVDQALNVLIDRDRRKRQRVAESRKRKRQAKVQEQAIRREHHP